MPFPQRVEDVVCRGGTARHFALQNAFAVRRKTIIFLRKNRKSQICGGRANVPPLQVFIEMRFFGNLTERHEGRPL